MTAPVRPTGRDPARRRQRDPRPAGSRGIRMRPIDLRQTDLRQTDLRQTDLRQTDLRLADLRLAGVALAVWLAALTALHLSPLAAVLLAGGAALGAAVSAAVLDRSAAGRARPPVGRFGWIAVAILLGVVCGAGATAARLTVRDADEIHGLAERRATVTATLVVRDDPRPVRGPAGRAPGVLVAAELTQLQRSDGVVVTTAARVLVLAGDPGWRRLLPGQRLIAAGRLAAPNGGDLTAAVLSAAGPPELIGRPSWAQRAAGFLRSGLQLACVPLPDEPGGLLPGLVVGDTSRLPASVDDDFRATGMTHLVAVSGTNVG